MSATLTLPTIGAPVREAFAAFPERQRRVLLEARNLVLAAAEGDARIGPLKRGEPAYLTEATGSGSTLRLGLTRQGRAPAIIVNCRTTLASEVRQRYGELFACEGTRGILLPGDVRARANAVRHVAWLALTYHLRRRMR